MTASDTQQRIGRIV